MGSVTGPTATTHPPTADPSVPLQSPSPCERPGGAQPVTYTTADPSVSPAVTHAPPRDRAVPSPSHTQPQIPLCPCSRPCPSERPGGAPACHIHPASTVTVPWNTSGVTGRRNALFSRSLFSFQSDPLSVSSSGPRAPTQGWQEVRVQGVSPTP